MVRDMFSDVREPSIKAGSQQRYTVAMSVIVHTAIIAAVMIIPLVATDVLPTPPVMTVFVSTPVPPSLPPPAPPVQTVAARRPEQDPSLAPLEAPSRISQETVDREGEPKLLDKIDGAVLGITDGMVESRADAVPPPRTSSPPAAIHAYSGIKPPTKIKNVTPLYSSVARAARVQGVVMIEVTIGPDGTVQVARVLHSVPLLDQAALDAVRQWEFTPTLLNGIPVPVIMTVTVNFTLQ